MTGSDDRTIRVWDSASGECLLVLKGHSASVGLADFASDGRRILSADSDGTARVWDSQWGECLTALIGSLSFCGL